MSLAEDLRKSMTESIEQRRVTNLRVVEENRQMKENKIKQHYDGVLKKFLDNSKKRAESGDCFSDICDFQCDEKGNVYDEECKIVINKLITWAESEGFKCETQIRNHKNEDDTWCQLNLRISWL